MKGKSPHDRLSRRVIRGGAWVFALRIVNQGLSITRLIILARILSPDDFGLMGIALLTMSSLEMFSQTGFQAALIQKKENIEAYLNSAWTIMIIRGVILFMILFTMAPYAAIFFGSPQAKSIIQVIGFSILLQSFANIGIIYFQKELEFKKQFIYQLSGTIADFVFAVIAALIMRNAWALVFGLLAGNFVRFIASYFIHPYRPRLCFDFHKARELFTFGKWIFFSSILVFLITQGDSILIGRLLGVTMLGYYQMAFRIAKIPATEITRIISQVTFPAYSKLQYEMNKLGKAFLKVLHVTAFLSFPIAGLIFVLAPDITIIFFGEKWIPMIPVLKILVLAGAIRSLAGAISPVFVSTGKPEIVTKYQAIQTILLFSLIFPLTSRLGIKGAALAVLLSALTIFFFRNAVLIKKIKCKVWDFYKLLIYPLAFTLIGACSIIYMKTFFVGMINMLSLLLFLGTFAFCFIFSSYIADKYFNYGIRALIREF